MESICVGDVVQATRNQTLWEFAEVLEMEEDVVTVCNTELFPGMLYTVSHHQIRRSPALESPPDGRQGGFPAPFTNLKRISCMLNNAVRDNISLEQFVYLFQAYGSTIEHLLNLGLRSDKRDDASLNAVLDFYQSVVRVTIAYFHRGDYEHDLMKFVLKLLSKAIDKGSALFAKNSVSPSLCPVFQEFLGLQGPELCLKLLHEIKIRSTSDIRYLNIIRLIPLFKAHRLFPSEIYVRFITEIFDKYQHPGILPSTAAKHYIAFIEEVDTCLSAYGLRHYMSQQQLYTLKRTQISLCVSLVLSNSSQFDSIEYFSALMKAHCRDTKFQQTLQEFSFSVEVLQEASRKLPEYMREYFFKICCMGNFSVDALMQVLDTSEEGLQRFISAEFFDDLLRYKATVFLLRLPKSIIAYCTSHFGGEDSVRDKLVTSGVDFRVLANFCPKFELNLNNCVLLANSAYSNFEVDKLLHDHFKTYDELITALEVAKPEHSKEKGRLLAIYYNTVVLQAMFVRKYSLFRRVPVSLFVQAFRDFY